MRRLFLCAACSAIINSEMLCQSLFSETTLNAKPTGFGGAADAPVGFGDGFISGSFERWFKSTSTEELSASLACLLFFKLQGCSNV